MRHISKIDGREYYISENGTFANGQWYSDDLTLIWTETQDEDQFLRFVNFYYGEYDYETTEDYIKSYLEMQNSNHISKVDNHRYWIESGCNSKTYVKGCIPGDSNCLIGYYEGEEDYDTTERCIEQYWLKRKGEKVMIVTEKANEIVKYLYEETKNHATSSTHIITFEEINNKFGVDMSNKFWQDTVHEESYTNYMDDIRTIDIDNVKKHIVVMMWASNTPQTIDLPICYVNLIEDCLEMIKKHNLLTLVYGDYADKDDEDAKKFDLQTVLDDFCKPLTDRDCDVSINVVD